jgi:hypothetical protein
MTCHPNGMVRKISRSDGVAFGIGLSANWRRRLLLVLLGRELPATTRASVT